MSAAAAEPGRLARAHLSRVVEPGDALLADELERHDWVELSDRLAAGAGPPRWLARQAALDGDTGELVERAARRGIRVVVPGDPEWPRGLDDLEPAGLGPASCLWLRGRLPVPAGDAGRGGAVAVVGARASTPYGEHVAAEAGAALAAGGWTVVSGAAYGIDAAAHRGSLAGARGTGVATVAVLACGVDRAYPSGHAGLLERILDAGGGVAAELPPGALPHRWRFLQRNRLIAAMSAATVVVEAATRSGASGTARAAAALSRPVGAVPGQVTHPASAGCHDLLREGVAVLVRDARDIAELASPVGTAWPGVGAAAHDGTGGHGEAGEADEADGERARRVLACLTPSQGLLTAQVAVMSGMAVGEARSALLDLEAAGRARSEGGAWIRCRRSGAPPAGRGPAPERATVHEL